MSDIQTTEPDGNDADPAVAKPRDDQTDQARPVGWIGLGATGLPMAVNIARRFALLGCDTDAARLSLLADEVGLQGVVHTTPVVAEVATRCDIIILMLPTTSAVEQVVTLLGAAFRPGTLVIDMGTANPEATRRLAAELSDRSVHLIDAPACGSLAEACAGRLTVLAGGAEAVVALAMPYLRLLGEPIIRTGPIGSGHAMAALKAFVGAAAALAALEAGRIGAAAGLDPNLVADVLSPDPSRPDDRLPPASMGAELEIVAAIAQATGSSGTLLAAMLEAWPRATDALNAGPVSS